jgi:uncharacterized protein YacL
MKLFRTINNSITNISVRLNTIQRAILASIFTLILALLTSLTIETFDLNKIVHWIWILYLITIGYFHYHFFSLLGNKPANDNDDQMPF